MWVSLLSGFFERERTVSFDGRDDCVDFFTAEDRRCRDNAEQSGLKVKIVL